MGLRANEISGEPLHSQWLEAEAGLEDTVPVGWSAAVVEQFVV